MAGWDGEKFGQDIVAAVNASIERAVTPLLARLDALESSVEKSQSLYAVIDSVVESVKSLNERPDGPLIKHMIDEVRADIETTLGPEMQIALSKMVEEAVSALPVPKDGKDAEPVDLDEMADRVRGMIELPEMPEIIIPELPDIAGMIETAVKAIPLPVTPELPDIAAMVDEAVAAIPAPVVINGKDADPVDMDIVRSMVDEAVSALPPAINGRDGADVTEALISGTDLHLVLSNGQMKNVGRVVGWDGVDVDIDGVNKRVNDMVAAIPAPKDGMGFDDLTMEHDGERTFKFVLSRGDQRKEFEFSVPVVLDRGVYVEGKTYAKGDSVTFGGSVHIAQTDGVTCKPGTSGDWRLAVKRGRDGRDGVMTVPKPHEPVKLGGR